ncbi:hypothetical protein EKN06_08160 [Croceicoccus ponticola]|uniref:Uncharacterized protein n=2 Tax=Croceicoccus ponticola TaxID=2217664 RepID=A0A437GXS5_9SPHN|nr:hypothetical protein EKN06_08160 [Croceicoccus ponticola]
MIAAAALVGLVAAPAMAAAKKDPEVRLAERLEGRVAGEPVRCIDTSRIRSSTIYDRTAIVFEAGSTLYVNRPDNGARALRRSDIMVTRPTINRLCNIDTVEMRDQSGFYSGSVFLGDFVPYKKAS